MIIGRQLIENQYESERLYSTGDLELDDLLEKAFCEGYEYAQREFAKKDYEGLSKKGQKELRELRSRIAEGLIKGRKFDNATDDLQRFSTDTYVKGLQRGASKLSKIIPEKKKEIGAFREDVRYAAGDMDKMYRAMRNKKIDNALMTSKAAAEGARKYVETKDKIRKRLGMISDNI